MSRLHSTEGRSKSPITQVHGAPSTRDAHEAEIEEAILLAERTIAELEARGSEDHLCESRWLEKMTKAIRLALVAEVDVGVLTRLHLRLETSLRRATMLLAEPDEPPPSQRPTLRPVSDGAMPASQRPTLIPARPASMVVPKLMAEDAVESPPPDRARSA